MLTRQQRRLLTIMRDRSEGGGVMPSFDEIRAEMGLASKSGIHRIMVALEERGAIRRLPNRARAVEILRPELAEPTPALPGDAGTVAVPVLGRVETDRCLPAPLVRTRDAEIPAHLLCGGETFAVTVGGSGLGRLGIVDGDLAVFRVGVPLTGGIAIGRTREGVSIGRYTLRGGSVALTTGDTARPGIVSGLPAIELLGRLAAVLRDCR